MMLAKLCTPFRALTRSFHAELERALAGCKKILDVGCGSDSPIKHVHRRFFAIGVDAYKPSIEKSKQKKIHSKYHILDIRDIGKKFPRESFDCVIALDVIEHLSKKEGLKLLDTMERISKKKTIVFTPNGFLPQPPAENPWQEHKSGWNVDEMRKKGYHIIGVNGWKPLRKEFAEIRFRPTLVWKTISDLTQLYVRNKPEKAFQLLCIKVK